MGKDNRNIILILLSIGVFVYTISLSIQNGWHKSWGGYPLRNISAAAIAISELQYGLNGYLAYNDVFKTIRGGLFGPRKLRTPQKKIAALNDHALLNRTIKKASSLKTPSGRKLGMGQEDVGMASYFKLAFSIFGYRIESFFYLYYFLLGISSVLFMVTFYKQANLLLFLLLFLSSHLMAAGAAAFVGPNLQTVYCSRFLPVLGVLPALYLALLIGGKYEFTMEMRIFTCIQTYILMLVIHARSSAVYQILFLISVFGLAVLHDWTERKKNEKFIINKLRVWPLAIVIIGFFLLEFHHTFSLDNSYPEAAGKHLFWHSAHMGLSANPDSMRKYGINALDSSAHMWVKKQARKLKLIKVPPKSYEDILKKRFFDILNKDPWFIIKSFSRKPFIFLSNYFGPPLFRPHYKVIRPDFIGNSFGASHLLLNWPILLIIGLAGILIKEAWLAEWKLIFGLLSLEFAFSMLPTMLYIPLPNVIADPGMVFTFIIYLLFSVMLCYLSILLIFIFFHTKIIAGLGRQ